MAVHELFQLKLRHTVGPRSLFLHDLVHDVSLDFILLRLEIRRHDIDCFDDVLRPIDIAQPFVTIRLHRSKSSVKPLSVYKLRFLDFEVGIQSPRLKSIKRVPLPINLDSLVDLGRLFDVLHLCVLVSCLEDAIESILGCHPLPGFKP